MVQPEASTCLGWVWFKFHIAKNKSSSSFLVLKYKQIQFLLYKASKRNNLLSPRRQLTQLQKRLSLTVYLCSGCCFPKNALYTNFAPEVISAGAKLTSIHKNHVVRSHVTWMFCSKENKEYFPSSAPILVYGRSTSTLQMILRASYQMHLPEFKHSRPDYRLDSICRLSEHTRALWCTAETITKVLGWKLWGS